MFGAHSSDSNLRFDPFLVAYHLYQMYLAKDALRKKKEGSPAESDFREPQDDEMQHEINRVASTLIRLMEVLH